MVLKLFVIVHVGTDNDLAITIYHNWAFISKSPHCTLQYSSFLAVGGAFFLYFFQAIKCENFNLSKRKLSEFSGINSCSFVITTFVALQAVFVFVWQPPVADMLQKVVGVPIRRMPVILLRALSVIESFANPRRDSPFVFSLPLLPFVFVPICSFEE